ncbi:MAG: hypothetical protein ACYCPO_12895 [Acidobacteriaceae bacterium]
MEKKKPGVDAGLLRLYTSRAASNCAGAAPISPIAAATCCSVRVAPLPISA